MIVKRQKEFVAPILAALANPGVTTGVIAGTTGLSMWQAHSEGKKTEEQAKKQEEQLRRQNTILNKIAKNSANNPEVAAQVAQVKQGNYSLVPKKFAVPSGATKILTAKNLKGFGKDIWGVIKGGKESLMSGVVFGGAGAAASYGANKAIELDMKKNGMFPKNEAAQKSYAVAGSIMGAAKSLGKTAWKVTKENPKTIATMATLGALPTGLGYIAERNQLKEQAKQSGNEAQQKEYAIKMSVPGAKSVMNGIKSAGKSVKTFFKDPITNIMSGVSSIGGTGGKKGLESFTKTMKNSENPISNKVGEFVGNHKKLAMTGSGLLGFGVVMPATWGGGEKAVRGTAKLLDKNAYAYEDSKNQMIQ